jgi:dynactin-4
MRLSRFLALLVSGRMSHEALFHCSCTSPFSQTRPPPSHDPLASFQHHSLSDLLFCEDCDAIRCDSCASVEIACYFCPNCLFEVPSASVRGEKNRCVLLFPLPSSSS